MIKVVLPPADQRWDDDQVLDDGRRDLPQICDLHGGLNPQVDEEDLHHSASEGAADLERNAEGVSLRSCWFTAQRLQQNFE